MEALLDVKNLTVHHLGRDGKVQTTLCGINFVIREGETLGLLGPSGCGKTTLALSLLCLLPTTAWVAGGSIRFRGHDILQANQATLRQIRGAQAAIIFQEPAAVLNPVIRVAEQIREVARAHMSGHVNRQVAQAALAEVGIDDDRILMAYPHQLSAGERQRVIIAQSLVCRPSLLIADEPTSALDNVTTREILTLLEKLKRQRGLSILFITHNPSLLLSLADQLVVMQNGRFIESGALIDVYQQPKHVYTQQLLRSIPTLPLAPL